MVSEGGLKKVLTFVFGETDQRSQVGEAESTGRIASVQTVRRIET
jgi:hypothetical protein